MGQSVGSRFVLGDLIGRGAMGRVHRGTARDDGHEVAIKLLRDDLADQPDIVSRFVQERRLLRTVSHPNVVRVHDLIVDGDVLAIVMDLVSDGDLTRLGRTPHEPVRAVTVLAEVADGLGAVHAAGVIHCDLKPANVLVHLRADGSAQPKLTDFGVSRLLSGTVTATQTVFGSPGYLAPEVASGRRPTPAADVYALGVMLYDFLTGRHPFVAEHPIALLRAHAMDPVPVPTGLPPELLALVLSMLAKDPLERPRAADVATRLRELAPELAGAGPFEVPEPGDEDPGPSAVTGDGPTLVGAPPVNPLSPVNGLPPMIGRTKHQPNLQPSPQPGPQPSPQPSPRPAAVVATAAAPTEVGSWATATPRTPARGYAPAPDTPSRGFDEGLLGLRTPPHVPGYPQSRPPNRPPKRQAPQPPSGSMELPPAPPPPPRESWIKRVPRPYLIGALTLVVLLVVSLAVTLFPRSQNADASTPKGDLTIQDTTVPSANSTTVANAPGTTLPVPSAVAKHAGRVTGAPRPTARVTGSGPIVTTATAPTTAPAAPPKVKNQNLPDGTVGQAYTATLLAKGTGDLVWSKAGGNLPGGLSLTSGGSVTGTPTDSGSSTFSVRVTDATGKSDTASVTIVVEAGHRTGDVNGDGSVDCADLTALESDIGTSAARSDLNGDGTVDDQDAAILQGLIGGTC